MFTWPTPEITEYERKFVRLYREPKLDAQGKPIPGQFWPGIIKRSYEAELWNNPNPAIPRMANAPQFIDKVQISRRARVFALTFAGDVYSWFLLIRTASGERYTNEPCLVSSMTAGTNYDAQAFIGEPSAPLAPGLAFESASSYALLIDPNWQLVPNETLYFEGSLAPALTGGEVIPDRTLSIGVHVWEFPGM